MTTRLLSIGLGAVGCLVAAQPQPGLPVTAVRGGLPNLARLLTDSTQAEAAVRMVTFGGGTTRGDGATRPDRCYRAPVGRELRALYPGCKLVELDKSLTRTGSWLGAHRVETEVNQHYLALALVVIEFAADDLGESEERVLAAVEGMVRQIRGRHKHADILFAYPLRLEYLADTTRGQLPEPIRWHERVAEHYGIPSANLGAHAAAAIAAGDVTFTEISSDGLHPTDRGHALYAEALKALLRLCRDAGTPAGLTAYTLPPPLTPRPLVQARLVSYERAVLEDGWLSWQESPVPRFFHVVSGDRHGPTISLRFKGASVGLFHALGPDAGDVEVSLDGGPWEPRRLFDAHAPSGYRPHGARLAEGLDPAAEHTLRLRVAAAVPAGSQGRTVRIAEFLVDGEAVYDDPLQGMTALDRIDAVYAGMEPVQYVPPPNRWQNLPRTRQRLAAGPDLTMVMLGDSIVNDTAHSFFDELLGRHYPTCAIRKVVSVRGSTGCWWYKEEGRVEEYVLRHRPDLLVIGGISHRQDLESIRSVIHQVRAALPEAEVLLMTGAFGSHDPRGDDTWSETAGADTPGYRGDLFRLAAEQNCAFLDMTGAWGRYVRDSVRAMGSFKRDPVHANDRGRQILGRILAAHLAP